MKCQILFSGKNKKNIINLSSAENAQRVVKVKLCIRIYQKNCKLFHFESELVYCLTELAHNTNSLPYST